jgi:electron transfer flavoprotein beta subunit
MAEKLNWPVVTCVENLLAFGGDTLRLRRNLSSGWEVVECRLPALLTVLEIANTPRPRVARRIMKYKRASAPSLVAADVAAQMADAAEEARADEAKKRCADLEVKGLLLEQWGLDELDVDLAWCGMSGSPTKVHRIQSVVLAGGQYKEFPPTDEGLAELVGELMEDHTIG